MYKWDETADCYKRILFGRREGLLGRDDGAIRARVPDVDKAECVGEELNIIEEDSGCESCGHGNETRLSHAADATEKGWRDQLAEYQNRNAEQARGIFENWRVNGRDALRGL
ncbi:hypothetical protein MMC25_007757 [Agyrium rufum]|nr:hypothetical protein [Agyrium rufum]